MSVMFLKKKMGINATLDLLYTDGLLPLISSKETTTIFCGVSNTGSLYVFGFTVHQLKIVLIIFLH